MTKRRIRYDLSRRDFIKMGLTSAAVCSLKILPGPALTLASGQEAFRFAYISDSHLLARGEKHRFAVALKKAVGDVNAMDPQPDFVLFGGDLAQLGLPDELELGKRLLEKAKAPIKMMVGEHDWYYDMGKHWMELFGAQTYSFDHKGIHFIVLNSVIVDDYWTASKMSPMERMKFMAQLDNPKGRPFTVGEEQRKWLQADLVQVDKKTPVVVFSHSPIYKYYKAWNFWTDDAEQVQALLAPFRVVSVIHGHTHQVLTNRYKNVGFHGMLSTAWPWPYAPEGLPELTRQMDRADPFNQFDGCGWGYVDVLPEGQVNKNYQLWDRDPMTVTYSRLISGQIPEQPDMLHSGPSY